MNKLAILIIIIVSSVLISVKMIRKNIAKKRISENFTMGEFMNTNVESLNIPDKEAQKNIERLVKNVLQPLRSYIKRPIIITSGFRSKEVNDRVGGALTSQHLKGEAADFVIESMSNDDIIETIKRLKLPFDQLIDEVKFRPDGSFTRWIHISLKKSNNRYEILKARNSTTDLKMRYTRK